MRAIKVMIVFGTRPEAIKLAPLIEEMGRCPAEIAVRVVVTAQHREMLDQVLHLFGIKPDYDLNIMKPGQSLFQITTAALNGLNEVYAAEAPDMVIVQGDTTTTFAAALGAFYRRIAVGHVEAGLRTGNKYSPFPEEMNRTLTTSLADQHYAPTATARDNLIREGVAPEKILVTGNTVVDALLQTAAKPYRFADPELAGIDYNGRRVLLVTTHRRENLGEPMRQVYRALADILDAYSDLELIFPVHKNPAVRAVVREILGGRDRVHLIEPLDYQPFVHLEQKCHLILSDSGGIQEEAPSLGKPVLVLRDTTERPEAVAAGTVKLVGTDREEIVRAVKILLDSEAEYRRMAGAVNPYGDGEASRRIVEAILHYFQRRADKPQPFRA
jgi:UDP-N-acetylglucosamine 2-epimerase (non-hydrolysing)